MTTGPSLKRTLARADRLLLPAVTGAALVLFAAETWVPLRPRVAARGPRTLRNGLFAVLSGVSMRWLVLPALLSVARLSERERRGLLPALVELPEVVRWTVGVALLDLGIYGWHRMNHHLPLLWRFHRVHHADPDLDVSTAFRFHPGEVLGSVVVRGLQVALIGPSPSLLLTYELLLQLASAFHHANLRVPLKLERALRLVLVTPRMHGAHHSIVAHEQNRNFAVLFSVWDRVFDSWGARFESQPAELGLAELQGTNELGAIRMLALPLRSPAVAGSGATQRRPAVTMKEALR